MLPETGRISMEQVNVELKKEYDSQISLNDTDVRKLSKINSDKISLNDLRGKSNTKIVHKTVNIFKINKENKYGNIEGEEYFDVYLEKIPDFKNGIMKFSYDVSLGYNYDNRVDFILNNKIGEEIPLAYFGTEVFENLYKETDYYGYCSYSDNMLDYFYYFVERPIDEDGSYLYTWVDFDCTLEADFIEQI